MLTMDQVTRVAREAAGETSPDFQVTGVLLGGSADSSYVEILINIVGCRSDVCQVSVGVFRDVTSSDLRQTIAIKLREHATTHPSSS